MGRMSESVPTVASTCEADANVCCISSSCCKTKGPDRFRGGPREWRLVLWFLHGASRLGPLSGATTTAHAIPSRHPPKLRWPRSRCQGIAASLTCTAIGLLAARGESHASSRPNLFRRLYVANLRKLQVFLRFGALIWRRISRPHSRSTSTMAARACTTALTGFHSPRADFAS